MVPSIWAAGLSRSGVLSAANAKQLVRHVSRTGDMSLREACVLLAIASSKQPGPDLKQVERRSNINAPAIFFVCDGLALKGLTTAPRAGTNVHVSLTDKGAALVDRCSL